MGSQELESDSDGPAASALVGRSGRGKYEDISTLKTKRGSGSGVGSRRVKSVGGEELTGISEGDCEAFRIGAEVMVYDDEDVVRVGETGGTS